MACYQTNAEAFAIAYGRKIKQREAQEVERVARAICTALGDDPDREGERLTAYDDAARAAIAALRPT